MKSIKALQTFYVCLLCLLPQLALGVSEIAEKISPLVPQGLVGVSASEEVSSLVPNKPPFLHQDNNKLPFETSSAGLVLDPPDQLLHIRGLQATLPWNQVGNDIDAEAANDNFGHSVAISKDGMRVAAGGHLNDENGNVSGHVRVYDYIAASTSWVQVGNDIDGDSGTLFGHSVAMSEDGMRVASGAIYGNHVKVYDWVASGGGGGGSWVQAGDDIVGEGLFGHSLAMSKDGMRIAAGGHMLDNFSGHVRVFDYIAASTSWVQLGNKISGDASSDNFGFSVAMSGEGLRVAIGGWGNGGAFNLGNSGHARVFDYSAASTSWVQVGNDIDGQADHSQTGYSVAMSKDGKRLAVGSLNSHISVYDDISGSWVQVGTDIPGGSGYDYTGMCVALSEDGTRMAAGSQENIRVLTSISGSWVQVGNDIDAQQAGNSINSVAMSNDGLRVVIGAPWNDKIGNDAGLVTVFVDPNPTPSPTGSPTPAPTTPSPTASPTFTSANQGKIFFSALSTSCFYPHFLQYLFDRLFRDSLHRRHHWNCYF